MTEEGKRSDPQATWLLVLITSTGIFGTAIVTPSLPGIGEAFAAEPDKAQWVLTGYLAMIAVGQLFFGPLSDKFGRRFPLLAGLACFLLGSVTAFLARDLNMLIAARCIQGLGASAAMVLPRLIINDTHAPRAAAGSLAAVTAAMALTPLVSFPFGGVLFEAVGWRGIMAAIVCVGLITTLPTALLLQETNSARQRSLSVSTVIENYYLLFSNRQFLLFASNLGLHVSIFFSFLNFLPFAFRELGYTPAEFGVHISLLPAGFVVGNLISRKWTATLGIIKMVRWGSILTVFAISVMAIVAFSGVQSGLALVLPAMIYSLSNGLTMPNASIGAINSVKRSAQGVGSGLAGSLQMLLGSLIASLTIWLGAANDVRIGISVVLGAALVALVAALLLRDDARLAVN